MSEWAGLVPTGRRIAGSVADLVELDDGQEGLKHTAIVFSERYREHEALHTGIELARGFMEFPMVAGLVELSHWLPEQGAFIYPTGTSWTAIEVLRTLRDAGGVTVPARAILEAAYLGGMILQEASETGPQQGVFAHGSLSPQRVLFKADGQVQIIGYGLPSVDIMAWREDESTAPHEDAFRYAPPERLAGLAEDGDSDIYTMCLVLWELLSGEPVYDGSIDQIRDLAKRGDADKRVTRAAPKVRKLIDGMADVWIKALNPDPDRRPSPLEFVQSVEALLAANSEGVTLSDVMEKVRDSSKRGTSLAAGDNTVARRRPAGLAGAAKGQLREAGAGILTFSATANARPGVPDAPPADAAPEAGNRWGKVARARGAEEPEAEKAGAAAAPAADARDKLRNRLRKGDGAAAEKPTEATASGSGSVDDARERLRNRLRGKTDAPAAAEKPTEKAAEKAPADDARARLRDRLKQTTPAAAAEPEKPAEAAEPAKSEAKADPREALRDRLKHRATASSDGAETAKTEAPAEAAKPETAADTQKTEAAAPADAREALRERLKARSSAGDQSTSPPTAPPAAEKAEKVEPEAKAEADAPKTEAAPAAAEPEKPAEKPAEKAEDPREALRRKLKERSGQK